MSASSAAGPARRTAVGAPVERMSRVSRVLAGPYADAGPLTATQVPAAARCRAARSVQVTRTAAGSVAWAGQLRTGRPAA